MAIEFKVVLENRPGTLSRICNVLGDAHVNIDAIQGFSHEHESIVQVVPNNSELAAQALEAANIESTQREVLLVRVLDEPGMLGDVAFVMAEAGINIDSVYVTSSGFAVFGVDDLDGAIQVAAGMAVMPST